jgi:hypothetical protein
LYISQFNAEYIRQFLIRQRRRAVGDGCLPDGFGGGSLTNQVGRIYAAQKSGVSDTVIKYMINTAPAPAPNAVAAQVAPAPAYYPGYCAYPFPWFFWPPVSFAFRVR